MLNLISVKGANAKFVGLIDSKGLGHTISWVTSEAKYKQYENLKAEKRTLNMEDMAGLWLIGPLPEGDALHKWTGAEFNAVTV